MAEPKEDKSLEPDYMQGGGPEHLHFKPNEPNQSS